MAILASDTFIRANQSGWGTASDGETWAFTGASATESISSNEGIIASTGGDTHGQLGSKTSANCEVLCRIAIGNVNDTVGIQGRFSPGTGGNTTTYKVLWYGGAIHLNKSVSGTNSQLTSVTFSMTVGIFYWFKLRVVGSSLIGKIWQDGNNESSATVTTITDTSVTGSGGFAVLGNTNIGTGVQFDHFSATDATVAYDLSWRGVISKTLAHDFSWRGLTSKTSNRDLSWRGVMSKTISRDLSWRGNLTPAPSFKSVVTGVVLDGFITAKVPDGKTTGVTPDGKVIGIPR